VDLLILVLIYAVPIASVVAVVRYGPVKSRWWRHENPIGFGLLVGFVSFLAGFFGPIILMPSANQGPLLGIIYTGPIGTMVGVAWGYLRAMKRKRVG
jgi:amino acid transporter